MQEGMGDYFVNIFIKFCIMKESIGDRKFVVFLIFKYFCQFFQVFFIKWKVIMKKFYECIEEFFYWIFFYCYFIFKFYF